MAEIVRALICAACLSEGWKDSQRVDRGLAFAPIVWINKYKDGSEKDHETGTVRERD